MHDLIIIGRGPAGMSAAIYAARKKLDQIVVGPDTGGQAAWALGIQNYPGFIMISGIDLATKFEEHMSEYKVPSIDGKVSSVEKHGTTFLTKMENGDQYESRVVLLASGRSARNLGVPGEEEFKGKGVAYCVTCEAPLYAGEDVAVVGSGNAGLSAAVQLSKIARKVYLLEELGHLTGDPVLQENIRLAPNTTVMINTEVNEIVGNKMAEGMRIHHFDSGQRENLAVTGIFVEIGSLPNTGFLPKDVKLNERREVEIDCSNRTSLPGLFAAGDVTAIPHKQIVIAAGEGAKALLTAYDYILHTFPRG